MTTIGSIGYEVIQSYEAAESVSSYAAYHEISIGDYLNNDKNFTYDIYIGWKHSATIGTNSTNRIPSIQFGRDNSGSYYAIGLDGVSRWHSGGNFGYLRDSGFGLFLSGEVVPSYLGNTGCMTKLRVRNSDTAGWGVSGWTVGAFNGSFISQTRIIAKGISGFANNVPDKFRIRPQTTNSSAQISEIWFDYLAITIHRVHDTLIDV